MIALNAVLVCLAALLAATLVGLELSETSKVVLVVVAAGGLSLIVNLTVLRARFAPLEHLIEEMEKVDLSRPGSNLPPSIDGRGETEEVERIELAFIRMMRRLEAERRRAGTAALRAQEEERARVARDLHDEVNQSLTGVLLRLEAARETAPPELEAELARDQGARQPGDAGAALPGPPAAADRARRPRPEGGDRRAGRPARRRPRSRHRSRPKGDFSDLADDVQLVVYRVAQEALSNAARHSGASRVEVTLRRAGTGVELEVSDDGAGFAFSEAEGGLGLPGMRERALLVGGEVVIESGPGRGTTCG